MPLNIAAYVAWSGVLLAIWQVGSDATAYSGLPLRAVAVGMLVLFLVGFLIATTRVPRSPMSRSYLGAAVMTVAILALLLAAPLDTTPVLLVIFASVVIGTLATRVGVSWLIFAIYGGFQAFGAFASFAMRRANENAEALRRVNAHLLAT